MNWETPPRSACLDAREVHVWRFDLDQPVRVAEQLGRQLSADERERAARFQFAVDRRRWQVCRGLLRKLLSSYVESRPEELVFRYGPRGKPYLVSELTLRLEFSVAHAKDQALFAFCREEDIGVDLECQRPLADLAGMMQACLSARELADMHALPNEERLNAFFRVWVRKEALIKGTGKGMHIPLREFDVGFGPEDSQDDLQLPAEHFGDEPWQVIDLEAPAGFVGALAMCGGSRRLRCYKGRVDRFAG